MIKSYLNNSYLAWEDVFDEIDFLDDVVDIPSGFRSFPLKDESSWMSPIDALCCDKFEPCWCPAPNLDGDNNIDFRLLPWLLFDALNSLLEVAEIFSLVTEPKSILLGDKADVFLTAKAQTSKASRAPSYPHRLSTSSIKLRYHDYSILHYQTMRLNMPRTTEEQILRGWVEIWSGAVDLFWYLSYFDAHIELNIKRRYNNKRFSS